MISVGVSLPASRAASAVMGLKVDPVGYPAAIARLKAGAPVPSVLSGSKICSKAALDSSGFARADGSKVGDEPIARISPVLTSSATNAPLRPAMASSPAA